MGKKLSKEVDKALRTTVLPLNNQGTCSMVRIGNTSMKPNHLVDNILQATEILAKKYPGGWKNIRSIHLKTETSMSIPIHISNLSANDVGFVDTTAAIKPKKEVITDELSTVLDAKVTVTPNFDVKVEGGQVPDQDLEFDDKEAESDSDNESSETPAKKKKTDDNKKKDVKKTKKKGKKEESEDEDDKEIEQAENEYLKRNVEQDGGEGEQDETNENDDDEEESDDDEEEEEGMEEDEG